jgi:hypothetical protein
LDFKAGNNGPGVDSDHLGDNAEVSQFKLQQLGQALEGLFGIARIGIVFIGV